MDRVIDAPVYQDILTWERGPDRGAPPSALGLSSQAPYFCYESLR
jgi:hypothetical protein